MTVRTIRDADLHARMLGPEVDASLRWLGERLAAEATVNWQINACTLMEHLRVAGDPGAPDPDELVRNVYRKCPPNLADRLVEALGIYRAVGWTCLPPLLPLAPHLLQAELHLYDSLSSGKPYRDHLAHQTRVAAMAHLLMSAGSPLPLPSPLRWESIRRRWSRTPEFQLLHAHALRRGLDCPDPAQHDSPWGQVVPAAALLAGLLHDMGYVHKSLGAVGEKVASTFRSLVFPPESSVDREVDDLPLGGLYRRTVSASAQGMRRAPLGEFLARTYRALHSVVGALWLATLNTRLGRTLARQERHRSASAPLGQTWPGWFDLTLQLAAMMAFAHDLACASKARRAQLGLRPGRGGMDVLNLQDLPLCTLFALADVTQEYGRPIHVIDPAVGARRFIVPVRGLRMEQPAPRDPPLPPPDPDRSASELRAEPVGRRRRLTTKQGEQRPPEQQHDLQSAGRLLDLPALLPAEAACLYLSYVTRRGGPSDALYDDETLALRARSDWEEWQVGSGQARWLVSSGLGPHVRFDGDAEAARRLKDTAARLGELIDKAQTSHADKRAAARLLRCLDLVFGATTRRPFRKIRDDAAGLCSPGSQVLPRVAPLAAGIAQGDLLAEESRRALDGASG